jgi:hypothetical protein
VRAHNKELAEQMFALRKENLRVSLEAMDQEQLLQDHNAIEVAAHAHKLRIHELEEEVRITHSMHAPASHDCETLFDSKA